MTLNIHQHEGRKYLRRITSPSGETIEVDVYAVLVAFGVTCPATAHAIKKLLAAGQRGKGSRLDDLQGALAAVSRAIEIKQTSAAMQLGDAIAKHSSEIGSDHVPIPHPATTEGGA